MQLSFQNLHAGAYEKYVLRVPNERDVPTNKVEIRFPEGLRVVSFGEVPGWKLQVLTDSVQNITAPSGPGFYPRSASSNSPSSRSTKGQHQHHLAHLPDLRRWGADRVDRPGQLVYPSFVHPRQQSRSGAHQGFRTSLYISIGACSSRLQPLPWLSATRRGREPLILT